MRLLPIGHWLLLLLLLPIPTFLPLMLSDLWLLLIFSLLLQLLIACLLLVSLACTHQPC